jgi:outer membrane protein
MRVACTCLLVVVLTAGAAAQPSAPPPGARLTLGEAIVRATETSHRLAELRAREGAARAAVGGRAAARRPTVAAQLGYTRTNRVEEFGVRTPDGAFRLLYPDVPDNYRSRLELQWPIYTGGRLEALERAAQAEAEATGRELAAARADLRLETTRSFWALVTALEAATVVERAVARVDAQLRDVRSRFEAGFVPPSDVLLVEAQRSRQQMLLIEARNQAAVAEAELARLVGLPDGSRLEVEAALDDPAGLEVTASEGLLEAARRARPERAALESRVGAAVERQAGAAAGGRPALALVSGVDYARPNPRIFPREDTWHESWDVGVALTWSLWDGGRVRAERAEAAQVSAAARERLAEFDSLLALEVRQRVLDLTSARAQIAASLDAVRAATEAQRVVRERFAAGVATSTELLDAEVALVQADLDRTRALAGARLARARLDRATGR